jgi:hypothetical protein
VCEYTIGVLGYCADPNDQTEFPFTLITTLSKAFKIFDRPQTHQSVAPKQMNRYQFCVRSNKTDVAAQLLSWTSASSCPNSYANLQMVVSKTNIDANYNDYVWRVTGGSGFLDTIYLLVTDPNVRAGSCKLSSIILIYFYFRNYLKIT